MEIPLKVLPEGLYFPDGDFYIDAFRPVSVCVVTHAHGDHAYFGHALYIATPETIKIMQHRMGGNLNCKPLSYGEKFKIGDAWISLHPAGHILGSSQVRIECKGIVTVISGDYKRAHDPTCLPFEVVECDIFVTESTFALPIYQWLPGQQIGQQILEWWDHNAANDHPSILFCYALGKSQRVMSLLAGQKNRQIHLHGAVFSIARLYKEMGVEMIPFVPVSESAKGTSFSKDLIIAPPSAMGSPWMKRFASSKTGSASGWMEVRGIRRRRALDKGFVLSDHADWNALVETVEQTKAKIVLTTHGDSSSLAHFLRETKNLDARELKGLKINMESEDE